MKKQNVIILLLDGLRTDKIDNLSFLNQLRDKCIYFNNMMAYAPYSLASSNALVTGCYGTINGVDNYYGSLNSNFKLDTIYEILTKNDYKTGLIIPTNLFLPHKDKVNNLVGIDFPNHLTTIDQILTYKRSIGTLMSLKNPFFLFINHVDMQARDYIQRAKEFDSLSDDYFNQIEFNSNYYNICFSNYDLVVKELYNYLLDLKILDNTLIFIISDHGMSLGEKWGETIYGSYCFDTTSRIFCLLLNSGFEPNHITQMIRNVDILPTILELLDIDIPLNLSGKSFVNLIKGEKDKRVAFIETGGLSGPCPSPKKPNVHAVRTDDWKLIYNSTTGMKQLYNLVNDPKEEQNLIMQDLEIKEELWQHMQKFLSQRKNQ